MKYQTADAFRTAIESRLKEHAGEHGEASLARMRRHIAFDRFLSRLNDVDPGNWTLKGGLALDYRLGEQARATRDIDLLHLPGMDRIEQVFEAVEAIESPDFFIFSIKRTDRLDNLVDGSAVRYSIESILNRRRFEQFVVDIGFDSTPGMRTEQVRRSGFLQFAGIEPVEFPALAIEFHLAEKLHAYSRIYADGRPSTRVKDLIDIVLIGKSFPLKASSCSQAIEQTFASRKSTLVPSSLGEPPDHWNVPYRELAESVGLDPDITVGHAFAAQLLNPILDGSCSNTAVWQADEAVWTSTT